MSTTGLSAADACPVCLMLQHAHAVAAAALLPANP